MVLVLVERLLWGREVGEVRTLRVTTRLFNVSCQFPIDQSNKHHTPHPTHSTPTTLPPHPTPPHSPIRRQPKTRMPSYSLPPVIPLPNPIPLPFSPSILPISRPNNPIPNRPLPLLPHLPHRLPHPIINVWTKRPWDRSVGVESAGGEHGGDGGVGEVAPC